MSKTTCGRGRLCNQIIRNLSLSILAKKYDLYVEYSNYDNINNKLVSRHPHIFDDKNDNSLTICSNSLKWLKKAGSSLHITRSFASLYKRLHHSFLYSPPTNLKSQVSIALLYTKRLLG